MLVAGGGGGCLVEVVVQVDILKSWTIPFPTNPLLQWVVGGYGGASGPSAGTLVLLTQL